MYVEIVEKWSIKEENSCVRTYSAVQITDSGFLLSFNGTKRIAVDVFNKIFCNF